MNIGVTEATDKRRQKPVNFTLDDETVEMLRQLADVDELQPGNRSNVVRRLIREEYKYNKKVARKLHRV